MNFDDYKYDPEKVSYFASVDKEGSHTAFGIKAKDRLRHIYVVGKTGVGKSTLLENLAVQDILNDDGLCFMDPHGQSAERLLRFVPKHRIKDVLYFAPFDLDFPVAFNVLENVEKDKRHLALSGIMGAFKKIWSGLWSSRMEYILQNTILALFDYPNTTLLDINRMLANQTFRKKVLHFVEDPIVKRFWIEEFANYSERHAQEATPAILNKIGQFVSNPLIRNIVGQSKSSFDLGEMINERKILIVNLSKSKLGEENARLLGALLSTKIYMETLLRGEVLPESGALAPFYLYVDEFHNFVNDSFADMLSEARKYGLSLTLAHQYIKQMDEKFRSAIFGNVGTVASFKVGPDDADFLEGLFAPVFKKEDFLSLSFGEIALSLMIDGSESKPFLAHTLPPLEYPDYDYSEKIIDYSRKRFGRARAEVEKDISEAEARIEKVQTFNEAESEKEKEKRESGGDLKKLAEKEKLREKIKKFAMEDASAESAGSDTASFVRKKSKPDNQKSGALFEVKPDKGFKKSLLQKALEKAMGHDKLFSSGQESTESAQKRGSDSPKNSNPQNPEQDAGLKDKQSARGGKKAEQESLGELLKEILEDADK